MSNLKLYISTAGTEREPNSADILALEEEVTQTYTLVGNLRNTEKGALYKHESQGYEAFYQPVFCAEIKSQIPEGEECYLRTGDSLLIRRKGELTGAKFVVEKTG